MLDKIIKIIAVALVCFPIFISTSVGAATIQASTCTQADVQVAITSAGNGDTISIPAGACTWTTYVVVGSASSRTKMVKFKGAGTDASVGTRITCNNTTNSPFSGGNSPCFVLWLDHNLAAFELTGIRFIQGDSWGNGDEEAAWALILAGHADTQASLFRIHHNHFEQKPGNIVNTGRIGGNNSYTSSFESGHPYIWGLIDHNTWHGTSSFQGIDILPNSSFVTTAAKGSSYQNDGHDAWDLWTITDHSGTWRNVFFEDNTITADAWGQNQAFGDFGAGGAVVYRNNILTNNWITSHGYEGFRAGKWIEMYKNIFVLNDPVGGYSGPSGTRGGTGVFYNNQFYDATNKGTYVSGSATRTWSDFFEVQYFRSTYRADGPSPNGATWCISSPAGQDSNNITSGAAKGWGCADQIGTRKGSADASMVYGYKWAQEPAVAWSNTYGARIADFYDYDNSPHLEPRRDYIDDGAATCAGHMAETICATFWDDVNNRKRNYVPYTYPHPLATGVAQDTQPPSPPQNLRVQ